MTEDAETPQPGEPFPSVEAVIDAFGGVRPMASRLGVAATTIQGWKSRGNIPENRRQEVRDGAAAAGIDLSALPHDPPAPEAPPAEEVPPVAEAGTAPQPTPQAAPAAKSGGQGIAWLALLTAVAVGAALVLQPEWAPTIYGNLAGGARPSVPSEVIARLDALEAKPAAPSLAPVTARLDALDAALKSLPAPTESGPDLAPRLDGLSATLDQRAAQLDALSGRVEQTIQALRQEVQSAADGAKADVAALRDEVAAL